MSENQSGENGEGRKPTKFLACLPVIINELKEARLEKEKNAKHTFEVKESKTDN